MFHVVLYEPEIPPNTGNIIRLCSNSGATLHLIEPLGFELDDKKLRRAGLDYREFADTRCYPCIEEFMARVSFNRLFTFSTHNRKCYDDARYEKNDAFLFGPETRGLPPHLRQLVVDDRQLTLPMVANSRSLNLSNTVAIVVYEAWRQLGFPSTHSSSR